MNQLAKKLLMTVACVAIVIGAPACCCKNKKNGKTYTARVKHVITDDKEVSMDQDMLDNGMNDLAVDELDVDAVMAEMPMDEEMTVVE